MKVQVTLTKAQAQAVLAAKLSAVPAGIRRTAALVEAERRIKEAIRTAVGPDASKST